MGKVVRFCHLLATTSQKALTGQCYSGGGRASPQLGIKNYSTVPSEPSTSMAATDMVSVQFTHGLPTLIVPLPSRDELCQFTLRPISDSVGTLCEHLTEEDRGVTFVAVYKDGTRISRSTSIQHLLQLQSFQLRINDRYYDVATPASVTKELQFLEHVQERLESGEKLNCLDDLKTKVAALYSVLNVDEFKLQREQALLANIEQVETDLRPLEEVRSRIEEECERYSNNVLWGGLAFMGVQTGIFARLTFWDYCKLLRFICILMEPCLAWDIMEPVTYFATFSTVMATLGYYLVTRQSFEYPTAQRRVFTKEFHKRAKTHNFDVDHYNALHNLRTELRQDLRRLRDPLYQHLPVGRLAALESENAKLRLTTAPKWNSSVNGTGKEPPLID
ncbi:Protein MCU-1 [Aphelenchoides avenae]|nr:Protein MCU-1 [Aphelenchus avenae]